MRLDQTDNLAIINQNFRDINPIICGQEQCLPLHTYGPASREYWLLHYVVSGKGRFSVRGNTFFVKASQCFVIRPYEISYYQADEKDPWHYIWIGFDCGVPLPAKLEQDVLDAAECGHIFTSLLEAWHMDAGREAFLCGRVWSLLAALWAGERSAEHSSAVRYVQLAKTFIEAEYMRGITVSELARRLNLDRSYFSTLFKRETALSPQRYLNDFRLSKAAELMIEHGYTPTMAALSTGYPGVFSFSRMFKRRFGVAPSRYTDGTAAGKQEQADKYTGKS